MNTPHELIIDVLGTSLAITTGDDPAHLEEVLAQYKIMVENTQNISGIQNPLGVAVLTGFLLCDEINKMKQQMEEVQKNTEIQRAGEARELDRITQKLINRIDRVLEITHTIPSAGQELTSEP